MRRYVVVLPFSANGAQILLIKKNKPKHLAGLWNGPGGKVEDTDGHIFRAAVRELQEETGVNLDGADVNMEHIIHMMYAENYYCFENSEFDYIDFLMVKTDKIYERQQMKDEEISIFHVDRLLAGRDKRKPQLVSNLKWMIPFALDKHRNVLLHCSEIGVEPLK